MYRFTFPQPPVKSTKSLYPLAIDDNKSQSESEVALHEDVAGNDKSLDPSAIRFDWI